MTAGDTVADAPDDPALAVDMLSFTYRGATGDQLREVSLVVPRGQRLAVMGATGAGKTTLAMACKGLIPQLHEGAVRGAVRVLGRDPLHEPVARLCDTVGLVLQDPESQVTGRTVVLDAAVGPANLGLPADVVWRRAREALELVGLTDLADRETSHLSGGQLQRLAIAGVLAMSPPVLVLDEPTSELDPAGTAAVFDLVRRLSGDGAHTVVLVEHESELIAEWAQRVVVLADGGIVFDGSPDELFGDPDRAAALGVRAPQVAQVMMRLRDDGQAAPAAPTTLSEAVRVLDRWSPASEAADARHHPRTRGRAATGTAIQTRGLHHVYPGGAAALVDMDCRVDEGEFVAVVGRNGAGKTTFARHLNGLLRPTGGEVRICGRPAAGRSVAELAHDVGFVFQNPDHQIFASSVADELAYGLRNAGWDPERIAARVDEVRRLVGLDVAPDTHPFRLGKGQRQRLAVASVLALSPRILVVDEPTTGQDHAGARAMLDLVADLNAAGHTILMVTHDMALVAEYARRVLVFDRARLVADATPAAVFADEDLLAAAGLVPPQVTLLGRALGLPRTVTTVDDCVAALRTERLRAR